MPELLAFGSGVRWARYRGYVVIVSPDGAIGHVDERAISFLTLLARGTTRKELRAVALAHMPTPERALIEVERLVGSLGRQGFLANEGTKPRHRPSARYLSQASDRIGWLLRRVCLHHPLPAIGLTVLTLAMVIYAIAIAPWHGSLTLVQTALTFRVEALLVVLAWLPAHEFAHAVAAATQRIPVRGLLFQRNRLGLLPSVATDVTDVLLCRSRWRRFVVYIAGPMTDVVFLAVALLVCANADAGYVRSLSASVVWLGVLILLANVSPTQSSDLSKALAHLGRDPLFLVKAGRVANTRKWHLVAFFCVVSVAAIGQALAW